jgi:carbonic anhydrase
MDCRLNPQEAMGWRLGEVTVCRNAGASAKDAARSLLVTTHLLGAEDIYVIKHTRCGLLGVPTEVVHSVMKKNMGLNESADVDSFDIIPISNLEESAKEDVEFLRNHPLALKKVRITGWIFDTDTGLINKIVD